MLARRDTLMEAAHLLNTLIVLFPFVASLVLALALT
jgi:hypothetical protein